MNIKRLLIIDRCLRDRSRQWSLDDLIEACSSTEKNSRRSVQADLELMRSAERGYSAPIIVVDKKYYIYKDENYSLVNQMLSDLDKKNIEDFEKLCELLKEKIEADENVEIIIVNQNISEETREKHRNRPNNIKVRCIETGIIYRSFSECGRQMGLDKSSISKVCRGELKHFHNYHSRNFSILKEYHQ